jgi:predicted PurR-regulated permease PerM
VNTALINKQVAAATAPVIAAMNKQVEAQANQYINNIHQIGQQTTARINASEAANSDEQASFNASQTANAQNVQGFSNYLLDQSVVQNNSTGAHSTQWTSTANALVQSNPSKYSYVSNSNLMPGEF